MSQAKASSHLMEVPRLIAGRIASAWGGWTQPLRAWAHRSAAAYVFELTDLAALARNVAQDPLPAECIFREADMDDMPACARLAEAGVDEYRRRLRLKEQCYAVFRSGRPVNLSWLHFGSCYVRGLGLLIEADAAECYVYNVFTDPDCRGMGLYRSTQHRLCKILAERGVRRVRQVVMEHNTIPCLALPKFGYELTEMIRHRSILGVKITAILDRQGRTIARQVFRKLPRDVFHI